jgi:hypothetical protein
VPTYELSKNVCFEKIHSVFQWIMMSQTRRTVLIYNILQCWLNRTAVAVNTKTRVGLQVFAVTCLVVIVYGYDVFQVGS